MTPILPSDEQLIALCEGAQGIFKLSDTLLVKFGIDITQAVATTQFYVWEHADPNIICIPKPYRFFQDISQGPGQTIGYLVMDYINGTDLSTYLECASNQAEEEIVNSIITALDHLLTLPVPAGQGPGPVGGGPPRGYLWSDSGIALSFANNSEMEDWLNKLLLDYGSEMMGEKVRFAPADLVICHTDLAPRNILRLSNGRLALLDWCNGGFYPRIFEAYSLRTRENREHIFTKILARITYDESQIQLLGRVEGILLHHGDAINYNFRHIPEDFDLGYQKAAPPSTAPIRLKDIS